jgi:preprotein translocase subunit SecY
MAKQSKADFRNNRATGLSELKERLFFVAFSLIIFRAGSFIPIPGIDTTILTSFLGQHHESVIEMLNVFSGGALSRASVFALGIMPYISASIIIQLLTALNPTLAEIKKEGEAGRRKINQYTRYATLVLAILQSLGIATGLPEVSGMAGLVVNPGLFFDFTTMISLTTGTMFLIWLGEQVTERGIGNGISIIIFAGIASGFPPAVIRIFEESRQGNLSFLALSMVVIFALIVTFLVVFIERGQRRITVSYAKRQQGRRVYAAQSTHLPLKVNASGVIPAIFSSSVILFPTTLISWFGSSTHWEWLDQTALYLRPGQPLYILLYAMAIIFFCFFYTSLVFNPRDTADNLKKSGAFIPGIRPGEQTAKHISRIMTRLTLFGSIYITFICIMPEIVHSVIRIPFYFGGTSLLIVVVVIIDFMSQVQTMVMSNQYESALKKANLKGQNR